VQWRASSTLTLAHGETVTASTHGTLVHGDTTLATGGLFQGAINIESLQSGVFCNAVVINSLAASTVGVPLPLVRMNPHPAQWSRLASRKLRQGFQSRRWRSPGSLCSGELSIGLAQ
jgi:hypothetical protein